MGRTGLQGLATQAAAALAATHLRLRRASLLLGSRRRRRGREAVRPNGGVTGGNGGQGARGEIWIISYRSAP